MTKKPQLMASTIEFFFFDDELLPTIPITLSHAGFLVRNPTQLAIALGKHLGIEID
jgi:hypothetical protein